MPNSIFDNSPHKRLGDFLKSEIHSGNNLSIVSAYFTIYAYEALRAELENAGAIRFLYGNPLGTETPDPKQSQEIQFNLSKSGGLELKNVLIQKPLAKSCADWIEKKVDIKSIKQNNFLHGKMYHVQRSHSNAAIVGSSNFTQRGIGYGDSPNIELNFQVVREEDQQELFNWFSELWNDKDRTFNAKERVLAALNRLGKNYSPEFVYFKTLFHIFEQELNDYEEQNRQIFDTNISETEIWKKLYQFQKDGATSAINRLKTHNGCIIADSVGLGKTWTALAVIKYFELLNDKVLVLCPSRLRDNWLQYTSYANWKNNPLESDRLNYNVLAHTDLSRYEGKSEGQDLANFNWGAFKLVVIDESHNFRNAVPNKTDDAGSVIRLSRYNRLVKEVLQSGPSTKVLMLSATPVNTSLRDLRNQVYLMTEMVDDAFKSSLGINSIKELFRRAQIQCQKWEKSKNTNHLLNKDNLLEDLGADFLSLLNAITLARSREHIKRYYPLVAKEVGGFPKRAKPKNIHVNAIGTNSFTYQELNARISEFDMSMYRPSEYLISDTQKLESHSHFTQSDREKFLSSMLRVNLLKRLESSVHSFNLSMERIINKINTYLEEIDKRHSPNSNDAQNNEVGPDIDEEGSDFEVGPDIDEEDNDFEVGKKVKYKLSDLDTEKWRGDLKKDRKVFQEIYSQTEKIKPELDEKLLKLMDELSHKVMSAPKDKKGKNNPKALVFTTFSDTAEYIYNNLKEWAKQTQVEIALITGGNGNSSTIGLTDFKKILHCFAPLAQNYSATGESDKKIDILIATDCLAEGQNLQDCDLVINYDIHWNPVRLMQRFGRIDRLGSQNKEISMTNFWPTEDLDLYLNLEERVRARMALVDATATGTDNPLEKEDHDRLKSELAFRDKQLKLIFNESLELEESDDGINLSDLTLNDFIAELFNFIQNNKAALEGAPLGIHATVPKLDSSDSNGRAQNANPGVIFCLKYDGNPEEITPNSIWPYFLIYITEDNRVRYTFKQVKQCLKIFRALTSGKTNPIDLLEDIFAEETLNGKCMEKYNILLEKALDNISRDFNKAEIKDILAGTGVKITPKNASKNLIEDFSLITWLVISS